MQSVRILESVDIELLDRLNVITGPNGSGKTSVLEALHILARGKSFRSPRIREVIRRQTDQLLVAATVHKSDKNIHCGVQRDTRQTVMKYNGDPVRSLSEQAKQLPILVLTPDSVSVMTGLPRERRRWLDWLMFHVEPDYLTIWNQFQKALRNRNSLLRAEASDSEFQPWESTMNECCIRLQASIENVLCLMQSELQTCLNVYLEGEATLRYLPGWNAEGSYGDYLQEHRQQHRESGYTSGGPQRSDLVFEVDGLSVSRVFSRGQAKMFLLALCLAEASIIFRMTEDSPVLLLDDICSELDDESTKKVIQNLKSSAFQCILTTTQAIPADNDIKVFHVEHGQFKQR